MVTDRIAAPPGWQLVPMEATDAMCAKGRELFLHDADWPQIWRGMLAVAPKREQPDFVVSKVPNS